jgi:hypothetical protein
MKNNWTKRRTREWHKMTKAEWFANRTLWRASISLVW